MPTRNINLTDHLDRFVEDQVEGGKYKNASEVLRAGLRLLEQETQTEERKLSLLKRLAAEGFEALDQGMGLSLDGDEQLPDAIGRIGRRAARTGSDRPVE